MTTVTRWRKSIPSPSSSRWAAKTRESIWDAMQRGETYGITGLRILDTGIVAWGYIQAAGDSRVVSADA
ncbi:DUF3604 domain-containing protein [Pseudomonas frederiksbergensis]|uniref:DUF3604 domain-containing protein n=1 Tax=Pseudomonas frederiksbergensis TaxID=104087 RepID=UPI003CCB9413